MFIRESLARYTNKPIALFNNALPSFVLFFKFFLARSLAKSTTVRTLVSPTGD